MRGSIRRPIAAAGLAFLFAFAGAATAGGVRPVADADGGGPYVNIVVREVRVAPVRAHVGDVIRIDMTLDDYGDLHYGTHDVDVRANGRIVASRLVTYGYGGEGGRIRTVSLSWDTRGAAPGEYRIRGEAFVWGDASEFDNFLDVREPVVLVRPGEAFPGGASAGGEAAAIDPRFRKTSAGGGSGAPAY